MTTIGDHIDIDAEQLLDLVHEPCQIEYRCLWTGVDEQIDVGCRIGFSASDRPEYPNATESATFGDSDDRLPLGAEAFECRAGQGGDYPCARRPVRRSPPTGVEVL